MVPRRSLARPALPALVLGSLVALSSVISSPSFAAGTPPSKVEPPSTSEMPASTLPPSPPDSAAMVAEAHARAKQLYEKGYKTTKDAKADLEKGKVKDAKKKFEKALKNFDEATQIWPELKEAWNMVGYTSRKTGDVKRAFAAYDRALTLDPDYEEAHEYLGDAYLMSGDLKRAKEQLEWLKAHNSEEKVDLEEAITRFEAGEKAPPGGW
jgi:tetratricopeptide (TPR) repeat protein